MKQKLQVILSAGLLAGCLIGAASGQTTQTVLDGVYTASQAAKGEEEYAAHCVKCHEGNDPDGPILFGRAFIDRWREDDLSTLFHFTKTRMPRDRSGGLSDSTYLQVLAFMLQANGYPAGAKDLALDALERIRFVGKDGPKPLPPNTLVKVVGCLTQDAGGEWLLMRSSEPVRSREGRETNADELKQSANKALGTQTFKLQNFTNIQFDFKPDPFKGHKVQIKGVLIRQSSGDRITLTSLESVATSCE